MPQVGVRPLLPDMGLPVSHPLDTCFSTTRDHVSKWPARISAYCTLQWEWFLYLAISQETVGVVHVHIHKFRPYFQGTVVVYMYMYIEKF